MAAIADETFDIVIVGAGPAGCALAARLAAARPRWTIALVEAGPRKPPFFSRVPLGLSVLVPRASRYNYAYETVPQPALDGRRGYQPRGRGVGGSSLINAMICNRGQREDYDGWAALGCTGWGWSDVLPLFRRIESNSRGESRLHGAHGPLPVSDLRERVPVTDAFLEAAREAGHAPNPDFNGDRQEGVGRYQVFQRDGARIDAGTAYLRDPPPNLSIVAGCRVDRVIVRDGEACGVEAVRGRTARTIGARKEVIVAAGAFGSPQLLMLSGIGPAAELARHGIASLADRPAVGADLQDHIDHVSSLRLDAPGVFGLTVRHLLRAAFSYRRFVRGGGGVLTTNFAEAGGFLRSHAEVERPDIQLHFCIGLVDDHSRTMHFFPGISLHACVLRPKSRGTVGLARPDPGAAPRIDPRFLSDPDDEALLLRGVRMARAILAAPAMRALGGRPLHPDDGSDAALIRSIRRTADTIYHPVGTCRMGADPGSVVDRALCVRGIGRLRVADASIMPRIVSGNTQAPSAMIGEKAAELVLAGDGA